ncbi:UNVERIFIED_CONTAM: hypothetical protein H355_009445 [Colinus virginianus]|nr:hypothetical protein H355_009445 [Colinus virginianus]
MGRNSPCVKRSEAVALNDVRISTYREGPYVEPPASQACRLISFDCIRRLNKQEADKTPGFCASHQMSSLQRMASFELAVPVPYLPFSNSRETMLTLGTQFPDFEADASGVTGKFKLYDYLGDSWGLLMSVLSVWLFVFSHPADFTPVCTTELAEAMKLDQEFKKRNCKLIGYSCNDVESHKKWAEDVVNYAQLSGELPYPIVADPDRKRATKLGIMDPDEVDKKGLPLTCRAAIFIGPDKRVKAIVLYPATVGRNFKELLRVLDGLQLTAKYPVATPEGWTPGDKVVIQPHVSNEDAKAKFPSGFETLACPSGRTYLRFTPDPSL